MDRAITSLQNPLVKTLVRLRSRRHRDGSGLFLVEGFREIRRALEREIELEQLFVCPDLFLGNNEPRLIEAARAQPSEIITVTDKVFAKISYRDRPEGLLAVVRQFPSDLDSLHLEDNPLLLVVESIEKPGNLGTMLRTADAAGADAVIVADPTTDPFNPNVVRASLGCLFTVPLAIASTIETIAWLRDRGVQTVSTTPNSTVALWDLDLRGSIAMVVGSEQYGLSREWLGSDHSPASLPMQGSADSLNAAMTAGIALFEAVRQRESES